jgi:hypothetical protein
MLYAVFHIVGALALTGGLIYTTLILNRIWGERADGQIYEQISIALGIPASTLRRGELTPEFIGHLSSRYSNDLLRNRLSDLWDTTLLVWDLLAHLILIVVAIFVLWAVATDSREWAKGMWFVPAVFVACKCVEAAMNMVCVALTGRYPGEARRWRKWVAETIEQREAMPVR